MSGKELSYRLAAESQRQVDKQKMQKQLAFHKQAAEMIS